MFHSPCLGEGAPRISSPLVRCGPPTTWLPVTFSTCDAKNFYPISGPSEITAGFSSARKRVPPGQQRASSGPPAGDSPEGAPSRARAREPQAKRRGCTAARGWSRNWALGRGSAFSNVKYDTPGLEGSPEEREACRAAARAVG